MRLLTWIVGLFALAVAVTVAARNSAGYLVLTLPSHRVELSVNLAVLLLLAAFALFYLVTRTAILAIGMPARAREYRRSQERTRARRMSEDALRAYLEGRYGRAVRAARQAAELDQWPALNLALAARSAHELRNYAARDAYLQQMETRAPQESYLRETTRADLLLEERRYLDALHSLGRLPDKHTGALRLELKAHQLAGNWEQVLSLLPQLEKRKVLEPLVLEQFRRYAVTENLKRKALDGKSLREYWDRLPAAGRADARVVAAAARGFIALGGCAEAHRIIEDTLAQTWDAALLMLYVECLPRDARKHLERAEEWLKQHPRDPVLLLALGLVCMHQALWGKARSYLEASLAIEPSHTGYVKLGELLERMGKPEEASQVYRRGLELALEQLKQCTGGRRRPIL
ncbi:MAG: heme biosynthesis HemY N-terminal domain-containing protein [Gammaproteobacteria bacterium]